MSTLKRSVGATVRVVGNATSLGTILSASGSSRRVQFKDRSGRKIVKTLPVGRLVAVPAKSSTIVKTITSIPQPESRTFRLTSDVNLKVTKGKTRFTTTGDYAGYSVSLKVMTDILKAVDRGGNNYTNIQIASRGIAVFPGITTIRIGCQDIPVSTIRSIVKWLGVKNEVITEKRFKIANKISCIAKQGSGRIQLTKGSYREGGIVTLEELQNILNVVDGKEFKVKPGYDEASRGDGKCLEINCTTRYVYISKGQKSFRIGCQTVQVSTVRNIVKFISKV